MFYKLCRFFLFLLPAETAHALVIKLMQFMSCTGIVNLIKAKQTKPVTVNHIKFKNPIGIAAGFDKAGTAITACESLGIGFIEVGTFTPKPQIGNPKPRLFRIPEINALINRMGFNNVGIEQAIKNIKTQNHTIPLGISIGKNNDTPEDEAINDYLFGMEKMAEFSDYLSVNISCPNVPNHKAFWAGESFTKLLTAVKKKQLELEQQTQRYVPIYLKISPDLTEADVLNFCAVFNASGLDGVIATNTSPGWRPEDYTNDVLLEKGGLSGAPIYPKVLKIIKLLKSNLKPGTTIIALGGIDSPEKAQECFTAGADLIQLYTGLIYEGPGLIKRILTILH